MKTEKLVQFLDTYLDVDNISDDSLNGLQVANSGEVRRVALAVDASLASFERSREAEVDFLFVHHGLFWGKPIPVRGVMYDRLRTLIDSDIALYAAHLPLDCHPEVGNNAQICSQMGWKDSEEFGEYHGTVIGKSVHIDPPLPFLQLVDLFRNALGDPFQVWDFGPAAVERLGIISGGGLSMIEQAVDSGLDALITGETEHKFYWTAREAAINVLLGGHYQTETLGVRAMGEKLKKTFDLETLFLDLPTGI